MPLVFGILTVVCGVVYLLWQFHKENPGFLSCAIAFLTLFLGPIALTGPIMEFNTTAGIIYCLLWGTVDIGFCVYMAVGHDKKAGEDIKESLEIWDEVYSLPEPDAETLRKCKIAARIPLYPQDCKTYNDAALSYWRRLQYNKRLSQKHKMVYYERY